MAVRHVAYVGSFAALPLSARVGLRASAGMRETQLGQHDATPGIRNGTGLWSGNALRVARA